MKYLKKILPILLIAWTLFSGLYLAWRDTMTTDEGIHMASGYLAVTRQDFRFDPEHPFLFKMLSALPVVALRPNLPPDDKKLWNAGEPIFYDSWREAREWTDQWVYKSGNNAQVLVFTFRLFSVLCLVALVFLIWKITSKWFGEKAGLWAMLAAAFNPILLGHGHTANTDVPIALAILIWMWFAWKYAEKSTTKNAIWLGLASGVTLTTKFSGIGILPVLVIILIIAKKRNQVKFWPNFLYILLTIYLFICLVYGFQSDYVTNGKTMEYFGYLSTVYHIQTSSIERFLYYLHYLIPSAFVKGLIYVQTSASFGRGTYLLGTHYFPNIWFYFPVVMFLKNTLIFVITLILGAFYTVSKFSWKKFSKSPNSNLVIWITFWIFFILIIMSKLNLGVRHASPILPILIIWFGIIMSKQEKWLQWTSGLLLCIPVILQLPAVFGYVNIFVHPYEQTYKFLNDSNVDWGQQVKDIKAYIDTQNCQSSCVVYYNNIWNPYAASYFGLNSQNFNPETILFENTKPAYLVATATQMASNEFTQFRNMTPVHIIFNNTYIFKLDGRLSD